MKKYPDYIVLLLIIASLFSCNLSKIEEFEVGKDFVESNYGIKLIDTMQIITSTVRQDSVITNNLNSLLIGNYKNIYTGMVSYTPFLEFANGSFSIYSENKFYYDSLVIKMNYNGYSVGDTLKPIDLEVRQLNESLKKRDDGYLYSTSSFQISSSILGEGKIYPTPHSTKNIYIRLSDQFGEDLFKKITDKNDTVQQSTLFKDYFKGLALVPHSIENSSVTGLISDSISLRVYYHTNSFSSGTDAKFYFSFPIDASSGTWYNRIYYSSDESILRLIDQNNHELLSPVTSNQTMVQGGSSIYTKIKIPGVNYIKSYSKNLVFIGAKIFLTPLIGSYQKASSLPDTLAVYKADRKNRITGQLKTSSLTVYAFKIIPERIDELPYYMADITPFFTAEIDDPEYTENSLFIGPLSSHLSSMASPVVFAPNTPGSAIVKMNVYCYTE